MAIFHSYVTNYQRVVRWVYKSTCNLATAPCTHRNPGHQMSPIEFRLYAQVHVEIFQFLLLNCRSEYSFLLAANTPSSFASQSHFSCWWLLIIPPKLRLENLISVATPIFAGATVMEKPQPIPFPSAGSWPRAARLNGYPTLVVSILIRNISWLVGGFKHLETY